MKLVVVGGGAAGMSAASKAKRLNKDLSVTVVESGNYVSYAECGIPYYLEDIVKSHDNLLHYPITEFTQKRGIDVLVNKRMTRIDRKNRKVSLSDGSELEYDRLVIATGARPKVPAEFSESGAFAIRSLESAVELKKALEGKKTVTVAGAGLLGMEIAASLMARGFKVKVISKHERVLPALDPDIGGKFNDEISKLMDIEYNSRITGLEKKSGSYSVETEHGKHDADVVVFSSGIIPNTEIAAEAGIDVDDRGLIKVDSNLRTSDENIYAAGDCATSRDIITGKPAWHPLAQVANKMGRLAGSNVAGKEAEFPGALGTSLVKIFDYEIGYTGLNERRAKEEGFNFGSTFVTAGSKANYYPGKQTVMAKIVFDKDTEKLIGGQIISKDGGAWRLNTLATAIQAGFTLNDLFNTDLGYTPPFGPVWDPLIISASVSMRD